MQRVYVEAPARLHMGFIDLSGALGRRFGSLGLTLDGLSTRLSAEKAKDLVVHGPEAQRAAAFAGRLIEALDIPGGARIQLTETIPPHTGLGSGTQLALAVGAALDRLYALETDPHTIAELLGRGTRSGVGIGAFLHGGVLVDGGKKAGAAPPTLIARFEYPPSWRALLIFDTENQGLHGAQEKSAFAELPPFSEDTAAHICRVVLMQILPALAESDMGPFARGVGELQRLTGDHFAPAQGGGRFTSRGVAEVMAWLRQLGLNALGQSSWGPTGFALVDSEMRARALLRDARVRFRGRSELRFFLARGQNTGARVEAMTAELAQPRDGR